MSMRVRRCASVWMTEISSASRVSSTRLGSTSPCCSRASVRSREPARQRRSSGDALGAASASTSMPHGGERVERNIDAVEIAIIRRRSPAKWLMICSAAQMRVGGGPGAAALAVHVEHETADRHRRIGAVAHEIVPVAVAQLGGVEAERLEQILRMLRRHAALGQRATQRDRLRHCRRWRRADRPPCGRASRPFRAADSDGWSAISSAERTNS